MMTVPRVRVSRFLVWVACGAGTVHALCSLYWSFGGQWLLATVGEWAVARSLEAPGKTRLALGLVAAVKLLAAVTPVAVIYGRLGWQRFWRAVSWVGGIGFVIYGGVNSVVSNAVLAGIIRPAGGYNEDAMIGHAWLWDPLFFIWGAALCLALWYSRRQPVSPVQKAARQGSGGRSGGSRPL